MDNFLGQRRASSSLPDHDDGTPAPAPATANGLLLSDSQISDLDLSSMENPDGSDQYGFMRSPLASVNTNRPSHLPAPPQTQLNPSSEYQRPLRVPSPYDTPYIAHHHRTSRNPAPSTRLNGQSLAPPDMYTSISLPPDRWEDDAVPIDPKRLPLHPDESQQDLAERINALTHAIQSNAQFCLALSGQMLILAKENKHLLPALSSRVSSAIANYVVEPALRLPGALKAYYPALQDYEDKLRRTMANCANGRDMVLAQGVGVGVRTESDIKRLKDRLVEQDTLLRDSSSHMQRLIRERDALRQRLSRTQQSSNASEIDGGGGAALGGQKNGREDRRDSAVLADQLRELRILVDQLTLDTASNHDRNGHGSNEEDEHGGADGQGGEEVEEEGDWTLL